MHYKNKLCAAIGLVYIYYYYLRSDLQRLRVHLLKKYFP